MSCLKQYDLNFQRALCYLEINMFKIIQIAKTPAAAVISLCFNKPELLSQIAQKQVIQRLSVKTLVYLIYLGHTRPQ